MTTVSDIMAAMEQIAPVRLAEAWDNVGLLIGSRDAAVKRCLLTIDLTDAVLEEAVTRKADAVIAYHPLIFSPLKRLTTGDAVQRVVLGAAAAGLAVYSPHTALDAAEQGINEFLAEGVGPSAVEPLVSAETLADADQLKIVTMAPREAADRIRRAMAKAGAGQIGDYEECSFELEGTGTFRGGPTTNPAVGEAGRFERVTESRLEMICDRKKLGLAVAALREAHPYEEPVIEIYALHPRPSIATGQGRVAVVKKALSTQAAAVRICSHLGLERVMTATASGRRRHTRIGFCAGAGGSLLNAAIEAKCTLFVTGELRHHDVMSATARGCDVILAGHTNTERPYLPRLKSRLTTLVRGVRFDVSRRDRDPLTVIEG